MRQQNNSIQWNAFSIRVCSERNVTRKKFSFVFCKFFREISHFFCENKRSERCENDTKAKVFLWIAKIFGKKYFSKTVSVIAATINCLKNSSIFKVLLSHLNNFSSDTLINVCWREFDFSSSIFLNLCPSTYLHPNKNSVFSSRNFRVFFA